jgi:hypothetical protein
MASFLILLGIALIVLGLVGLALPAVPGTPLLFMGIVAIAAADGFARVSPITLFVLALLAFVSWALDYAVGILGARTAGASRWGVIGGAVGMVAGLPFGLPGLILGPALGATVLEYYKDPDFRRAARAGAGVFAGFVVGTVLKFTLAFMMLGITAVAYLY